MTAEIVLTGARALTMDPDRPEAQAVAIGDGRILAVGTDEEILTLAGPQTRRIDAEGRTLLPGFVESHVHLFMGGYGMTVLQVAGLRGVDALREATHAYVEAHPEAALIVGHGADYQMLGKGQRIDRHVLDDICPDRPFVLMAYDFHSAWANTAALEASGLLHGADLPLGSEVVMGEDGRATGALLEKLAFLPVMDLRTFGGRESLGMTGVEPAEPPSEQDRQDDREILKLGLRHAAEHGVTSMHNMDGNRYMMELLREIEAEGDLLATVRVPFHLTPEMTLGELDRASAMARDFTGPGVIGGFVKIFLDGVIASGTAALLEPYATRPGHRGDTLFSRERFIEAAVEIDRRGMQIAIHAIGDAAVRLALDGYEAAAQANGPRDRRHRIEHVEMLSAEDSHRFAELGVVASMQPPHAPLEEDDTTAGIGAARADRAYVWRELAESGAHIAFSSDWPIVPISPLAGIQAAMTRKNWLPGLPDQRLPLRDVLAAYTSGGAYVGFTEGETGMLRPGLRADLALLSGDIEATAPEKIGAMSVDLTLFGGRVTHER